MSENVQELKEAAREEGAKMEDALKAIEATSVPTSDDTEGELLCGLKVVDENGQTKVYKDYEIRESDGADEEAVSAIVKKQGGAKVANRILELMVERIGPFVKNQMKPQKWRTEVIEKLVVPDQDFLLFQIRKLISDEEVESLHQCPNNGCHAKIKLFFNLDELEIKPYTGSEEQEEVFKLPVGYVDEQGNVHDEIRMRMANGLDREVCMPTARINEKKATTLIFSRICEFTDGYPLNENILRKMKTRDRKKMEEVNKTMLDFGIQTEVQVECNQCGLVFEDKISALANFF